MGKKEKKYSDLYDFEIKYTERIEKFIKDDEIESKVVFLNADFGWGKTTFIKEILSIKGKFVFSPWMNNSTNYLEEIYYQVTGKNKAKITNTVIFMVIFTTFLLAILNFVGNIFINMFNSEIICNIIDLKVVSCQTQGQLLLLLKYTILFIIFVTLVLWVISKLNMTSIYLYSFYKNKHGENYERYLINCIVKQMKKENSILVIEDIDRTDFIEEVLISIKKISDSLEDSNYYILITGDYVRCINRLSFFDNYENIRTDYSLQYRGDYILERLIALRVDFINKEERINNVLVDYKLSIHLSKIERDEIIKFISNRFLSIRFFVKFIEENIEEIKRGNNLFYLLLDFFQLERLFNVDIIRDVDSVYNSNGFPCCINDYEFLLQSNFKKIKIHNRLISIENILSMVENDSASNLIEINKLFINLFFERESHKVHIFKNFYSGLKYPILNKDLEQINEYNEYFNYPEYEEDINRNIPLILNFILSNNFPKDEENINLNKRCYFSNVSRKSSLSNVMVTNISQFIAVEVVNEDFHCAFIACFLRDNKKEIEKNYPEINKLIKEIIK